MSSLSGIWGILGVLGIPLVLGTGCSDSASSGASPRDVGESSVVRTEIVIEEPDVYHVEGDTLYVQNAETGLNVLDVSNPSSPRLVGRAPVAGGKGGEILVQPNDIVVVLLKIATPQCRNLPGLDTGSGAAAGAELAIVDAGDRASPTILGRYCLPRGLVASRTVDSTLFVVLSDGIESHAVSISLLDPAAPRRVADVTLAGGSREIVLTATTLVVASKAQQNVTSVQYVSLAPTGEMRLRGVAKVQGDPQGRFHMDLRNNQFRIVTFDIFENASRLTVLDVSDPDSIVTLGKLDAIAPGERLYATRFDGNRAYIVTFRRTDPLWVVSLANPERPVVVGELMVPGWSDYIYPLGTRLLAVGRGASWGPSGNGAFVGMSLFDVTDATQPKVLTQLELGRGAQGSTSTSEANVDFRGVTLFQAADGKTVAALGYGGVRWYKDDVGRVACSAGNNLQLVDVEPNRLVVRGKVGQNGAVRRSTLIEDRLMAISEMEVQSIDISNRDELKVAGRVEVGSAESQQEDLKEICEKSFSFYYGGGCTVAATPASPIELGLPALAVVMVGLGGLIARRRRGRAARLLAALAVGGAGLVGAGGLARADRQAVPDDCDPGIQACQPAVPAQPAPAMQPMQPAPAMQPMQPIPGFQPQPGFQPMQPYPAPPGTPGVMDPYRYAPSPWLSEPPPRVEERRRWGLFAGGMAMFGSAWTLTSTIGYIAGEGRLAIPAVGPLVYLAHYRERFDCSNPPPDTVLFCATEDDGDRMLYFWLVADALVQTAGLAMAVAGFFTREKVVVRDRPRWSVLPSAGPGGVALTAVGTF